MNRLAGPVQAWWSGRTVRERQMLTVMLALIAALVVWLTLVRPVLAWRAAAGARAELAAETLAGIRAAAPPAPPVRPAPSGGLEPLIRRTAEAAGLEVVTVMSPSGQLGIQLSSVGSAALFVWLGGLESDHHLRICSLGVTENADATLNVEGAVAVGTCDG